MCSIVEKVPVSQIFLVNLHQEKQYCIMGIRLNKVLKQLNVGTETIVEYLKSKPGLEPTKEMNHNTKVTEEQYAALLEEFRGDKLVREKANSIFPVTSREQKPSLRIIDGVRNDIKIVGKIDLDSINQSTRPKKKTKEEREAERRAKRTEWLSKTRSRQREGDAKHDDETNKRIINDNVFQKKIKIFLSELTFGKDCLTFTMHGETFSFVYEGLRTYMNLYRENSLLGSAYSEITLDYKNHSFFFEDYSVFNVLQKFMTVVDADMKKNERIWTRR